MAIRSDYEDNPYNGYVERRIRENYSDSMPRYRRSRLQMFDIFSPIGLVVSVALFAITMGIVIVATRLLSILTSGWLLAMAYSYGMLTIAMPLLVTGAGIVWLIKYILKPQTTNVDGIGTIIHGRKGQKTIIAPSELFALETKDSTKTSYDLMNRQPIDEDEDDYDTISESRPTISLEETFSSYPTDKEILASNDAEQAILNEVQETRNAAQIAEDKQKKILIKKHMDMGYSARDISKKVKLEGANYPKYMRLAKEVREGNMS